MPDASHLGRQNGYGRKKGTPNKATADIKAMILGALSDVGGRDYLARQAVENPGSFLTLVGKVLPLQLAGHDGQRLVVDFRWADGAAPLTIDADASTSVADETTTVTFIGEC